MSWDRIRLKEVTVKIGSGATPRGGKDTYIAEGISLIRSQNIYNWGFQYDGLAHINEKQAHKLANVKVDSGDILLNITGDSVCRSCMVPDQVLPARVNQHVSIIRADRRRLDNRFLRFVLISPIIQSQLMQLASGGATRNALTKEMLEDLEIPFPPLEEQRRIAHILGTLDDKIELNRRMNQTLDELARTIFRSWFVDFDPVRAKMEGRQPEGMDAATAALFPDHFVDSPLGDIPAGWEVKRIDSLCESIANGGTPKRMEPSYWDQGTINWFKTGELLDGPLLASEEKITELGLRKSSAKLWGKGTILVALYASPTVGRLGVLTEPAAANQACSGLVVNESVGRNFVYYSLLESRQTLQRIAVGAAQQNISKRVLQQHEVVVPGERITLTYHELVEPLYQYRANLARENQILAELRDTLLPELMSGRSGCSN